MTRGTRKILYSGRKNILTIEQDPEKYAVPIYSMVATKNMFTLIIIIKQNSS